MLSFRLHKLLFHEIKVCSSMHPSCQECHPQPHWRSRRSPVSAAPPLLRPPPWERHSHSITDPSSQGPEVSCSSGPLLVLGHGLWASVAKREAMRTPLECASRQWVFQFLILGDSFRMLGTEEIGHQILDPYLGKRGTNPLSLLMECCKEVGGNLNGTTIKSVLHIVWEGWVCVC